MMPSFNAISRGYTPYLLALEKNLNFANKLANRISIGNYMLLSVICAI